ncbi:MAG: hypothetical protein HQL51_10695 [Magnetococcales bacterium]|nr:hypothetical protein [Magnetococcales bacterium]
MPAADEPEVRTYQVVCEGSSDFALIEGIIADAGKRAGREFRANLLQPQMDATRGGYEPGGWNNVERWCRRNQGKRLLGMLAFASALFIHMDTDIAHEIMQDGETFAEGGGVSRRRWCECALNGWLGWSQTAPGVYYVLPTHQIETWLLATYPLSSLQTHFTPPEDENFETIRNVESILLKFGFAEDRDKPGRLYKEFAAYQKKHLPLLLSNASLARRRCGELDRLFGALES